MYNIIAHQRDKDGQKQSVSEHLIAVSKLARISTGKIGLPLIGELCGLLHDLGKYSQEFQHYINSALGNIDPDAEEYVDANGKKGKIDHSTAGAQHVWQKLQEGVSVRSLIAQIVSLSIASHHSGLLDCISPDGLDKFSIRIGKNDNKTHYTEVVENCEKPILSRIHEIIIVPDLIHEFEDAEKKIKRITKVTHNFQRGLLTRYIFSCLLDADRTDTADFERPDDAALRFNSQYPAWENFIFLLEKRLTLFKNRNIVDEIRAIVSMECHNRGKDNQGIFSLTVPTGGGKTLASLRFALQHAHKHNLDRIFYIIPYTSIIDQNVREVQKIFHSLSERYGVELVLEHHSNLTPENRTEQETTTQKLLSENWDSPIVFTTSVQLLETLFSGGTRSARRMHQLANSVIIFDEIQTLPVKTVHLFNNAMNFLTDVCNSSVLLCTATQPLLHKVDRKKGAIALSKEGEIISNIHNLFAKLKRVNVIDRTRVEGWSSEDVAGLIKDELEKSRTVLTIVNSKKSAKELYILCQNFDATIFHLSTDMCSAHRVEILNEIKEKIDPENENIEKIICISTQLIEAGVDVDFGSVIRYLAGLDSIAQAAGRCNRNGRRDFGEVSIVNHATENINKLKEIKIGQDVTTRVLSEYKNSLSDFGNSLLSPQTIERYFEYYFFNRKDLMSYPVSSNKNVQEDTLLEMLSKNEKAVRIHNNSEPLPQSFATTGKLFKAIDSYTQGVIVPYGEGKEIITELCASQDISKEFKLIKRAQRFSVNCYDYTIKSLDAGGALYNIQDSGIFYLDDEHYSSSFGLSLEPVETNSNTSFMC
ncbi:MAG: CRISPR-associated helicase Cas3' [Bacteroidetes bacterium]|nr:CRISPR-associated helicase Cas3' [Bacteroidota bacterium]